MIHLNVWDELDDIELEQDRYQRSVGTPRQLVSEWGSGGTVDYEAVRGVCARNSHEV